MSTGHARDHIDAAVDLEDPIPASHLKGLMRAGARDVVAIGAHDLDAVFGAGRDGGGSPWAWDSAFPVTGTWKGVVRKTRVRIEVEDRSGSALPDHLQVGELLWPDPALRAVFTVTRSGYLPPAARLRHEAVLRLAGQAVTALGAQRRRGLGWVSIRPTDTGGRNAATTDLALVRAEER